MQRQSCSHSYVVKYEPFRYMDRFAQSPEAWFETPFVNLCHLYKLLTRILLAGVKMPCSLAHLQHYCSVTGN